MADAARYHRLQLLLTLLGLGVSLAYLLAVLVMGGGHAAAHWAARVTAARWGQVALVALLLGAGHGALGLPITLVRGYWLPRRFGLLHQPLRGWLADRLKAMLIGGALGLAAVELVYALLELTPLWWLVAAAVFLAAQVAMTAVLPVWIVPLFYRMAPLADDGLRERLLALARRAGVAAIGVFVADQSRKSRTANAAVVGLGRTRRIILFDTLLAEFPPEEIESVLAHELGHHVHGDVRRGLLVQGALMLVTFGLAALGLDAGVALLGLAGPADPAGLPWLALVALALGLVQLPLGNGFSRWIERQADDFALATTGNSPAFVGAMERLARLNLAERRPNRLKEIVLYSHPALERRIARARGATMDRGGPA
ncbi:MAG TPA: M48 family metalloprotease [Candidatus Binatia bacterium]|nr:M48 family metalloprotease [Candidatus Binatia bacterium]